MTGSVLSGSSVPARRVTNLPASRMAAPSPWIARRLPASSPGLFTGCRLLVQWDTAGGYVDVTDRLTRDPVKIRFGRATEFDEVSPGVLTFGLDNSDGLLTPENPASVLYPNVVEDRKVLFDVFRGARSWRRFSGWIRSIDPSFPKGSTAGAIIAVSAVDDLGVMATFPLLSQWLTAARWYAGLTSSHWDGFVITGDGEATIDFDNVTDSTSANAYAVVQSTTNNRGTLRFGNADGLSVEGSVSFSPASNDSGAVIRVGVGTPIRMLQFWLRLPSTVQTSATKTQLDLVVFKDGLNSAMGSIRLTNNGGQQDVGWFNAAGTFVGQLAFSSAEDRWVRVSALTRTATPTQTDFYYDGGGIVGGGFLGANALDLRNVRGIYFGGEGTLVPQMEVAGIVLMGSESFSIPAYLGQVAGTNGGTVTVSERVAWVAQRMPVPVVVYPGADYSRKAMTGTWHGRKALDVVQEIARSCGGVAFGRVRDSTSVVLPSSLLYPPQPVVTVDAELDLIGAPRIQRAVESRPTRIEVTYPAGKATVVDDDAEAAASGQVRGKGFSTVVATGNDAYDLGAQALARVGQGSRITNMTLDLETGVTDVVPALFEDASLIGGMFPSQRIRLTVPEAYFGVSSKDVHVEGWTEIYDPVGGCRMDLDLSPAAPSLADQPLAVATWVQQFQEPTPPNLPSWTARKPGGLRKGELLVAVQITDNDGSLATMTAAGFTLASSGSGSAGFGKLWTKVATASEPADYVFGVDTDSIGVVTLLRVTGADTTNPIVTASWASTAAVTNSHAAPSISPAVGGLLVCGWYFVFLPASATTWTLPAGFTADGIVAQAGAYGQQIVGHKSVSAGATGTQTATSSISSSALGNLGVSFVIRPAT